MLALAQAIGLLTARPATLLGVEAGRLAKGRPADLCLFHPERVWQVEAGRAARQGAEHPVRRPRAGGRRAGHLEGRAAGVRIEPG